jgi:indolepyruvate ferredoxin oxidoreductase
MLRALGLKRKINLAPWFRWVFVVLYSLRRLRGTPFDVFGYAHVRKVERELIDEYRSLVKALLARLTTQNYATVVEIAALPDLVRGYEQIKLDNVETYRTQVREQLAALDARESLSVSG